MIDTIIFDLDGVLINSKNIHFESLNQSIKEANLTYQISYEDLPMFLDRHQYKIRLKSSPHHH